MPFFKAAIREALCFISFKVPFPGKMSEHLLRFESQFFPFVLNEEQPDAEERDGKGGGEPTLAKSWVGTQAKNQPRLRHKSTKPSSKTVPRVGLGIQVNLQKS